MYCKDGNNSHFLMLQQYFPTANVVSHVFRKGYLYIYMIDRHPYLMFWSKMNPTVLDKTHPQTVLGISLIFLPMHHSNKLTIFTCSCLMFYFSVISGNFFKGIHNLKWTCMALQAPSSGCWCWQESAFLQCGSSMICDYSSNFWKTLSTICHLHCGLLLLSNNMQMCHL